MGSNYAAFTAGLSTFLIGVTMVFVALLLLIVLITIIGKVVAKLENKPNLELNQNESNTTKEVMPVEAKTIEVNIEDEFELVAVITASIASTLGTTSDRLQIRSLRQVNRRVK